MAKRVLQELELRAALVPPRPVASWEEADQIVRSLPPRTNLVIPKSSLSGAPPFCTSRRGRRRGALRQFRDHRATHSLHVKEYPGHWIIHVDDWNPHHHVLRHLMVDRGYDRFFHVALIGTGDARPDSTPA